MRTVNALVPAGKTPLTSGVEQAAEVLNYRSKPGVIVVVTDGEETCGDRPAAWPSNSTSRQTSSPFTSSPSPTRATPGRGNSVMDLMCLANENNGLYTRANSEDDLVDALEKTLDCPMISQAPLR